MKCLILHERTYGETFVTKSYRECHKYAQKHGLIIAQALEVTPENKSGLLNDVFQLLASVNDAPNALIVPDLGIISLPEKENLFLPLVKAGRIELHIVSHGLRFTKDSPPELLKEGGFKAAEEQAFFTKFFEEYDKEMEEYNP